MSKYFVYALVSPINNEPFYFGKGCGNRPYKHLNGQDKTNSKKLDRIDWIRFLGHEPEVHFVQTDMAENDALSLEYSCIKLGIAHGYPLTNKVGVMNPPSRKGVKLSDEHRAKITIALKARVRGAMSEEQKRKLSVSNIKVRKPHRLQVDFNKLNEMRKTMTVKQIADYYGVSLYPINRLIRESKKLSEKTNS